MANPEHVKIVKQGAAAIRKWRKEHESERLNLSKADLVATDLSGADLSLVNLTRANLDETDLNGANLHSASLLGTDLSGAYLVETNFEQVNMVFVSFAQNNLSVAKNLDKIQHHGPSFISTFTLEESKGRIPKKFLRGCGFTPWQIMCAELFNTDLSPADVVEIQDRMYRERTKGFYMGGVFISYSHDDSNFVDKIEKELQEIGANLWRDIHQAVAGPLAKQVERGIRIQDTVLLVLSEASIESDWVEAELEWTREKEKREKRDILCPIALDDSWKGKVEGDVLWRQVKKKNVLDFSNWENEWSDDTPFEPFRKLEDGLKRYYGPGASKP